MAIRIICDVCGSDTRDSMGMNNEYARFTAHWGYGSKRDDERWDYVLCQECAMWVLEVIGLSEEEA
jgi:hypothetical protein|tara:strand:- start:26787 stop:26984 length:198 start_codon:yes stop_codon:yes gene_type:complete